MTIERSLARQAERPEAAARVALARYHLAGDDAEAAGGKALHLIAKGSRILALGNPDPALLRDLQQEHGCDVTAVQVGPDAAAPEGDFSGLPGGPDDGFDVVLLSNALEHLRDPLPVLHTAKKHLRREGYVVARVPNVAHGTVRLALLDGRFPLGDDGPEDAPVRFFTYDSLVGLFEQAGFAIGMVEREEADIAPPAGGVSPDVMGSVADAPEARTARFVVAAYPLPWVGLGWLQRRLRELIVQAADARREADALRSDLDAVTDHVRLLVEQQEGAVRREKDLRAKVLEGHDRLAQRDEEYRTILKALHESGERERDLHEKLAAGCAYVNRLDEEKREAAAREHDLREWLAAATARAAEREAYADHVRRHRDELEARVQRVGRSLPGRMYKLVRRVVKGR